MEYFVNTDSVVRKIWGNADTVLFIFAGASAEFALNKAVDWLYFTGKLPADPIGRLFSTVCYAQQIVFSPLEQAHTAIDKITAIHASVEKSRGTLIPDWAYRDVLYMLIHYSIASFELLEKKLSMQEKEEVFDVFYRVGCRMQLKDLPSTYAQWITSRAAHLQNNLQKGSLTVDLFNQYKKHLGAGRFWLLKEAQKLVIPKAVAAMLQFDKYAVLTLLLPLYKMSRLIKADRPIKSMMLPALYRKRIDALNRV
jgi:hypothetical protein